MPGKNIRPLCGVPLIAYSIDAARALGKEEDIVVSTDSEEIAEISRRSGARVPFMRDAKLATDTAGSREVILDAVERMNADLPEGEEPYDTVVLLQPTTPFRNLDDIRKAIELYREKRPDMVVSVRAASANPYYNAYESRDDGTLKISKGEGGYTRRQDAPKVWEMDGAFYVIDVDALRRYPGLARMSRILPYENTCTEHVDIDNEIDFLTAEELCRRHRR